MGLFNSKPALVEPDVDILPPRFEKAPLVTDRISVSPMEYMFGKDRRNKLFESHLPPIQKVSLGVGLLPGIGENTVLGFHTDVGKRGPSAFGLSLGLFESVNDNAIQNELHLSDDGNIRASSQIYSPANNLGFYALIPIDRIIDNLLKVPKGSPNPSELGVGSLDLKHYMDNPYQRKTRSVMPEVGARYVSPADTYSFGAHVGLTGALPVKAWCVGAVPLVSKSSENVEFSNNSIGAGPLPPPIPGSGLKAFFGFQLSTLLGARQSGLSLQTLKDAVGGLNRPPLGLVEHLNSVDSERVDGSDGVIDSTSRVSAAASGVVSGSNAENADKLSLQHELLLRDYSPVSSILNALPPLAVDAALSVADSPFYELSIALDSRNKELVAGYTRSYLLRRSVYNPFEKKQVKGVYQYLDLGLEVRRPLVSSFDISESRNNYSENGTLVNPLQDALPNAAARVAIGAQLQLNRMVLLKARAGTRDLAVGATIRSTTIPTLAVAVSAAYDRVTHNHGFGVALSLDAGGSPSYQKRFTAQPTALPYVSVDSVKSGEFISGSSDSVTGISSVPVDFGSFERQWRKLPDPRVFF